MVVGTSPLEHAHTRVFEADLPSKFWNGRPFKASVPPGVATIMIVRIADETAEAIKTQRPVVTFQPALTEA